MNKPMGTANDIIDAVRAAGATRVEVTETQPFIVVVDTDLDPDRCAALPAELFSLTPIGVTVVVVPTYYEAS